MTVKSINQAPYYYGTEELPISGRFAIKFDANRHAYLDHWLEEREYLGLAVPLLVLMQRRIIMLSILTAVFCPHEVLLQSR